MNPGLRQSFFQAATGDVDHLVIYTKVKTGESPPLNLDKQQQEKISTMILIFLFIRVRVKRDPPANAQTAFVTIQGAIGEKLWTFKVFVEHFTRQTAKSC